MSTKATRTEFPAGDFISENAVRAVFGRRRPTSPTTSARAINRLPPHTSAAGQNTSTPAGQTRQLRRWSVAELIARALAPPPTTT
jgi:hypothetical protein